MAEPEPTASKPPATPVPTPPAQPPPAGATTADAEAPVLHSTRLPPATGPSLGTADDDEDMRGGELRDALAELRTSLDAGTAAPPRRGVRLLRRRTPAMSGHESPAAEALPVTPVAERVEPVHEPLAAPVAEPVEPIARPPVGPVARPSAEPEPVDAADPADAAEPVDATEVGRPARGRTAALATAVAAVVIVVALAVTRGPLTHQDGAAPAPSASPVPTGPAPAATASGVVPTPAASPAAPPPPATRPLPSPGGSVLAPAGLPVAGPGADAPGTELTAAVDPDRQHVDVYERVVLRPGDTSVLLAAPSAAGLPAELRRLRPVVEDLQAEVEGRPVAPVAEGRGWRVTNPDGGGVRQLVLRYRLRGALARQEPAPPGRVSLLLRPLTGDASLGTGDPVVVRIDDRRVGSLYCPAPQPALCGSDAGTLHTATVPAGAAPVVLAQVTL